jgi:hypothetical protein
VRSRWLFGIAAVALLAAQWWITMYARHLLPLEGLIIGVAVIVLIAVNFVRTRRRGTRVADTLRPDAMEFTSLQDDLLGRTTSTGPPPSTEPVATQLHHQRDPLDGFSAKSSDPEQQR